MFAISTAAIVPRATPSDSARPGVVGVDVDLQRRRVADDQDRVAERLELRLDLVGVEPVALDHERGAVLELREPEMDRVDARRALLDARRRGSGAPVRTPAMPRRISTSPAAPASTTPASASTGSISRVRTTQSSPRATSAARSPPASAASASSRIAVSIVPSTGFLTALYAASLADRSAAARSSLVARDSAAPRTICERITPELPRAPISAARETSCASAARSSGPPASSASTTARDGQREVRAGVAVRHRVDVQVVDPPARALDRRQRPAGQLQHAFPHDTLTSSTTTSTDSTGRPVSRSTS